MRQRWQVILWAVLFSAFSLYAENEDRLPEYQVKAMYLGLLPDYVRWPKPNGSSDDSAPFKLGVLGSSPFEGSLQEVFRSQSLGKRTIQIKYSRTLRDLLDCQVIFICESDTYRLPEILAALRGRPILTVADTPDSALQGVMINLCLERKRVTIEVNLKALRASGLEASAHMLKLAKIVE